MKKEDTGHLLTKASLSSFRSKLLHSPRIYDYSWSITNQPENWVCRLGTLLGCVAILFCYVYILSIYPQAQTGLPVGLSPHDTVWREGPLVEGRLGQQWPLPLLPH